MEYVKVKKNLNLLTYLLIQRPNHQLNVFTICQITLNVMPNTYKLTLFWIF